MQALAVSGQKRPRHYVAWRRGCVGIYTRRAASSVREPVGRKSRCHHAGRARHLSWHTHQNTPRIWPRIPACGAHHYARGRRAQGAGQQHLTGSSSCRTGGCRPGGPGCPCQRWNTRHSPFQLAYLGPIAIARSRAAGQINKWLFRTPRSITSVGNLAPQVHSISEGLSSAHWVQG